MTLNICYDKPFLGISNGRINLIIENNKIVEKSELNNCYELPFLLAERFLVYNGLLIPLIFKEDKAILARILFLLSGKTNHELFYYKNKQTSIFIDDNLLNIELDNLSKSYTKICGNYGSTRLVYCITNNKISILSSNKNYAEEALLSFKKFLDLVSRINNFVRPEFSEK
ncbi:hypothetical protein DFR86_05425 [Acidianus sulfidivorans JP7]|uniref:Uncharacterized protein n=1 Tax=Acidianus sulfidivorans JP7 TaxID=619593 RepID=A0A2U9IM02_9CREN|nr:hypothetical protein [Acidianus sulfidivorans]AWR97056.1 hypothetical protein DFR86_05425 [Acidianus sulfidivorans JP7]